MEKHGKSEQVCVLIPFDLLKEIDNMIKNNLFGSRSAIIRRALKEFLDKTKVLA